jgi:hypothetical protein
VLRETLAAEMAGEWLMAAHGYAHLVAYGSTTDTGCGSPDVSGGGWQLPLWTPLLRIRFAESTEQAEQAVADRWAIAYSVNLNRAKEEIVRARSPKSDPVASSSHDLTRR